MFKISLFENTVDELKSAHLYTATFLDWQYDYAVPDIEKLFAFKQMIKHLCSSWELLMKYRIATFDPKAIFTKPDQINNENLKSGDFHTIGHLKAEAFLNKEHIHCSFTNLNQLYNYRNKIEHFEIDVPFEALIHTAIGAIDELIKFSSSHIIPVIEDRGILYQADDILVQLWMAKKELESLLVDGI